MTKNSNINDIIIVGFGSQANAWALNLRDSGRSVTIALRRGSSSLSRVEALGFDSIVIEDSKSLDSNFIIILTPDDTHLRILNSLDIKPSQNFVYAHGFSATYQELKSVFKDHNHFLLAPKAIASEVRFSYETKSPLCAVVSDDQNASFRQLVIDLGVNVGPILSTFEEETICDLFSEQALLCSTIPEVARLSFETLVENGHDPHIAYIECWHEVKLIADAMIKLGPVAFLELISPNAFIGGERAKLLIFDDDFKNKLKKLYADIKNGQFYDEILHTDFQKLSTQVISEWKEHQLSEVYEDLGAKLANRNEDTNN